ncbi:UNVERIFIED_CONTAM: 4-coumarate--CoA ligase-like 7 [Sesamum indicum]
MQTETTPTPLLYSEDGIHRSPRPPIFLPNLSMISFLFRKLPSNAHSPALIQAETGQTLTFSDLKTQVFNFSKTLLDFNISKNDVVLIISPNSLLFPVAIFAVVAVGAIATTANPLCTAAEISKQVKDSNPKLIITTPQLHDKIKHLNLPCIMLATSKIPIYSSTTSSNSTWYYSHSDTFSSDIALPPVMQTDVAAILYSSGTTGTSKGVVLTHRNFIASALMMTSDQESYGDSRNVFLCFLPMFHIFGLSALLYAQLQRGNTVVVMARHEMKKMLSAVEKYKVTHLWVVPPVVVELAKHQEMVKEYDISSVREILSGAAPLGKETAEECARIFPDAVVYQVMNEHILILTVLCVEFVSLEIGIDDRLRGYGMTETGGPISFGNVRTDTPYSGSTGVLAPGVEAQIVNLGTMKPLPPLRRGEIWVRGLMVMQGYFNNQKATMETIDEQGWLHTGDIGYFDEKGRLYVVDRVKELIKCNGYQVAPAELEELLLTHPEIKDAAVIGLADAEVGEVPIAYVVRSSTTSLVEEEVKTFIAEQVAAYKRLRRVIFTDSIPKSASGKILRKELAQRFLSKL